MKKIQEIKADKVGLVCWYERVVNIDLNVAKVVIEICCDDSNISGKQQRNWLIKKYAGGKLIDQEYYAMYSNW